MLAAAKSAVLALFAPAPAKPEPIAARNVAIAQIGRGSVDPTHRKGQRRIVVTVDEELFERIRARAVGKRVPIAAAIRHLLACGLDAGGRP